MKRSVWSRQLGAVLIAALAWSSSAMFGASVASAEVPPLLPVQGYLTDATSAPLDGTHQIRFRLYDADTAGTSLFEETLDVNVADGFFTIYLGDTVALDLAIFRDHTEVYLGIKVGTDAEAAPRLQLASTGFASLAAYCGDAETVGGLEPDDFQARVSGTCSAGQFMQSIDANGSVTCMSAPAETDPLIGSLSAGRYCTSNGSSITCDQTLPAEADPQVGTLNVGGSCFSNGTLINCTGATPLFAESDPKIGSLTNGRYCTTNGSSITCDQTLPAEADPQVGTLTAGNWCASDGTAVHCNQPAPTEGDPQVGALTTSAVPRWDGSALSPGRIFDNNANVGINNASPNRELDVGGDVEVTGSYRYASAKTFNTFLGTSAFTPGSLADLQDWAKSSAGYGYMNNASASAGGVAMFADVALPDGASIATVSCVYQDKSTDSTININSTGMYLYRRAFTSETTNTVFSSIISTTGTESNATPVANVWTDSSASTAGFEVVDNSSYDYYMYILWNVTNDATSLLKFYGCRITYTLTQVAFP